jgi:anti-anti-sigma factor
MEKKTTKFAVTREGEKVTVKPGTDVIASELAEFRPVLKTIVNDGAMELVIDLDGVAMIDSMGIGLIIAAHNSLKKSGGRLEAVNLSKDIHTLFKHMRLDQHFTVVGK